MTDDSQWAVAEHNDVRVSTLSQLPATSGALDLPKHSRGIESDDVRHLQELDQLQPTLASFELGDERLRSIQL